MFGIGKNRTPEENRAALKGISFEEAERICAESQKIDVSELDFTPEPFKITGIEADGYKNSTQAMLDSATERQQMIEAAIEKNTTDAKAEHARLMEEKAKNAKVIESTLAALAVFGVSGQAIPRAEPRRPFVKGPRLSSTPIVIYGPQASGKTRHIHKIAEEMNRRGVNIVDDWHGESVIPKGSIVTTTVQPTEFVSSDSSTDYHWINIEAFHKFPWWVESIPHHPV